MVGHIPIASTRSADSYLCPLKNGTAVQVQAKPFLRLYLGAKQVLGHLRAGSSLTPEGRWGRAKGSNRERFRRLSVLNINVQVSLDFMLSGRVDDVDEDSIFYTSSITCRLKF